MTDNERLGGVQSEGGAQGRGANLGDPRCRLLRKVQLSAACVDSGYEHLRQDAIHVAMHDAVERWEAGVSCGLMFLSLGEDGTIHLGRVEATATAFEHGTRELGNTVWMMACDRRTTALLIWTDCGTWAKRCGRGLVAGQLFMQCIDMSGCQSGTVAPRREAVLTWSSGAEPRLIDVQAWQPRGYMALN